MLSMLSILSIDNLFFLTSFAENNKKANIHEIMSKYLPTFQSK
jgi:hypothetical protein